MSIDFTMRPDAFCDEAYLSDDTSSELDSFDPGVHCPYCFKGFSGTDAFLDDVLIDGKGELLLDGYCHIPVHSACLSEMAASEDGTPLPDIIHSALIKIEQMVSEPEEKKELKHHFFEHIAYDNDDLSMRDVIMRYNADWNFEAASNAFNAVLEKNECLKAPELIDREVLKSLIIALEV